MKDKFFTFLFFLLCISITKAQDCNLPTSINELSINDVTANLSHGGTLWNNGYAIPDLGILQVYSFLSGHLWLGGFDPGGNLKLAADYGEEFVVARDFYAGPLNDISTPSPGTIDQATCALFNQHWKVSKSEVDIFLEDFEEDGEINDIHNAIFLWPGSANPYYEEELGLPIPKQDLAPFIDLNNNDTYEPSLGEYPNIKGDQAVWWVFNDNGSIHQNTQGNALQFEVGVLAYAYETGSETLESSTFYELTFTNKAIESIDSLYATLAFQIGLGCPDDDHFGCLPNEDIGYIYNGDDTDGSNGCTCENGYNTYCNSIPVLGIKILETPETTNLAENRLANFSYFNQSFSSSPASRPFGVVEYYNRMSGSWRDGSSYKNQGDGISEGEETNYVFSGNPGLGEGHSMCESDVDFQRRTMLMSTGPYRLEPGVKGKLSFVVYWVPELGGCPDVDPIIRIGEELEEVYNENITSTAKATEVSYSYVFPNPIQSDLYINAKQEIVRVSLYDSQAKLVKSEVINMEKTIHLNYSNIPAGMYVLSVNYKNGYTERHKIIWQ